MNYLVQGNVLDVCSLLPSDILFDLVYLDPPYGVGMIMQTRTGIDAYSDLVQGQDLINILIPCLCAIRDRMKQEAMMYLHLDYRAVHEAKVACDFLFGYDAFVGEIIWVPGNGGRGVGFPKTHQTILVYSRTPGCIMFNSDDPELREAYANTSLAMHFRQRDDVGRLYRERKVKDKTYRYYADEGRKLGSVWTDIPGMIANTPLMTESTGYPTQKPERLLERIIRASSAPGATVADLMCGSGTTLVAAARLGRGFVGADQSPVAIQTTAERLVKENIKYNH